MPAAASARRPREPVAVAAPARRAAPVGRAEAAASNGDRATQSDKPIMKRALLLLLILAGVGAGSYYLRRTSAEAESATGTAGTPERRARGGGGGFGGGGFGGFGSFGGPRLPMSVELASVK